MMIDLLRFIRKRLKSLKNPSIIEIYSLAEKQAVKELWQQDIYLNSKNQIMSAKTLHPAHQQAILKKYDIQYLIINEVSKNVPPSKTNS
jgi:hypothetical protein